MSTVKVPGVKVIEFAKKVKPVSDLKEVFTLIIPGFIGREGLITLKATSRFALKHSQINRGI